MPAPAPAPQKNTVAVPWDYRLRICPITCGLPTAMGEDSFQTMCSIHQQKAASQRRQVQNSKAIFFCHDHCRGTTPPVELTIKKTEEKTMPSKKTIGRCQLCDKEANVTTIHEHWACATCASVLGHVHVRPQLVADLLRKVHGDEYQPAPLMDEKEIRAQALLMSSKTVTDLQGRLDAMAIDSAETIAQLRCQISASNEENAKLREEVANMHGSLLLSREFPPIAAETVHDPRATALLDIALGLLDGSVTGITPETIKELR